MLHNKIMAILVRLVTIEDCDKWLRIYYTIPLHVQAKIRPIYDNVRSRFMLEFAARVKEASRSESHRRQDPNDEDIIYSDGTFTYNRVEEVEFRHTYNPETGVPNNWSAVPSDVSKVSFDS